MCVVCHGNKGHRTAVILCKIVEQLAVTWSIRQQTNIMEGCVETKFISSCAGRAGHRKYCRDFGWPRVFFTFSHLPFALTSFISAQRSDLHCMYNSILHQYPVMMSIHGSTGPVSPVCGGRRGQAGCSAEIGCCRREAGTSLCS